MIKNLITLTMLGILFSLPFATDANHSRPQSEIDAINRIFDKFELAYELGVISQSTYSKFTNFLNIFLHQSHEKMMEHDDISVIPTNGVPELNKNEYSFEYPGFSYPGQYLTVNLPDNFNYAKSYLTLNTRPDGSGKEIGRVNHLSQGKSQAYVTIYSLGYEVLNDTYKIEGLPGSRAGTSIPAFLLLKTPGKSKPDGFLEASIHMPLIDGNRVASTSYQAENHGGYIALDATNNDLVRLYYDDKAGKWFSDPTGSDWGSDYWAGEVCKDYYSSSYSASLVKTKVKFKNVYQKNGPGFETVNFDQGLYDVYACLIKG